MDRRKFIEGAALVAGAGILSTDFLMATSAPKPVKVLVWDERQPRQQQAYENFLGNQIAGHLKQQPGLSVISSALDDAEQGLSDNQLDNTDVMIWWGHVRQAEIAPEKGKQIVEKIRAGSLSLIALHSAHWATPFVECMNEVTRMRAKVNRPGNEHEEFIYVQPPKQYTVPKYDSRLTPYTITRKFPEGKVKHEVHLPFCCFPAYRNDGKPSFVKVLNQRHPIVKGIPASFQIPETEMYDEPFHVPDPDEVVLEESWANGEWFRSGMIWKLGKGNIFYFRPGHETFPVYKQEWPLKILTNAVRWMGTNKTRGA
jgi:trehalose utilization protein